MRAAIAFLAALCLHRGSVSGGSSCLATTQNKLFDTRIVGGVLAELGEFPWQASIRASQTHLCGGAIIGEQWILSAAHCFILKTAADLSVVVGTIYLNNLGSYIQTTQVSKLVVNSKFNWKVSSYHNDIALLQLKTKLVFSTYVNKISLPQSNYTASGNGVVSGWGATTEAGNLSSVLYWVEVPIMTRAICVDYYGDEVQDGMMCAGYDSGGKDSCQGDSGGPLVCDKKTVLCGIVSAGDGCARPEQPGIYSDVAYFVDWITSTVG
ncbi:trypsin-1-like [Bacillus rossius redtenbacheri]|uniref:trypsin-1-like n=1 Tax=Bacillus rossius redtenbacheri TaxID=93214 RepID=UPI002FDE3F02